MFLDEGEIIEGREEELQRVNTRSMVEEKGEGIKNKFEGRLKRGRLQALEEEIKRKIKI